MQIQSFVNTEGTVNGSEFGLGWALAVGERQTPWPLTLPLVHTIRICLPLLTSFPAWSGLLAFLSPVIFPDVLRSSLSTPTSASLSRNHGISQHGFLLSPATIAAPLSERLCRAAGKAVVPAFATYRLCGQGQVKQLL